jgi:hypothetical protein
MGRHPPAGFLLKALLNYCTISWSTWMIDGIHMKCRCSRMSVVHRPYFSRWSWRHSGTTWPSKLGIPVAIGISR